MQFEAAKSFMLDKLKNELSLRLYYHNIEHTLDVLDVANKLAGFENLSEYDTCLLLTAACFHDAGYLTLAKGHEAESCRIVRYYLPDFAYTPAEISTICKIIMATHIPQTPKDKSGQILADADLDYLGRDDFQPLSDLLYKELIESGTVMPDDSEWNKTQIAFFNQHRYFTLTSKKLRGDKKEDNLKYIKLKLKRIFEE